MGVSAAVVDGNPAITYNCSNDLLYVRSTTTTGTSAADWGEPITIIEGTVLSDDWLHVVNGNPAVAYTGRAGDGWHLRYTHSATTSGLDPEDWCVPVTVDGTVEKAGYLPVLGTVNGNPAIVYTITGASLYDLRYVRSSTINGTSPSDWEARQTIDTNSGYGQTHSMTIVNGNPAISFRGSMGKLTYAYYQP